MRGRASNSSAVSSGERSMFPVSRSTPQVFRGEGPVMGCLLDSSSFEREVESGGSKVEGVRAECAKHHDSVSALADWKAISRRGVSLAVHDSTMRGTHFYSQRSSYSNSLSSVPSSYSVAIQVS